MGSDFVLGQCEYVLAPATRATVIVDALDSGIRGNDGFERGAALERGEGVAEEGENVIG